MKIAIYGSRRQTAYLGPIKAFIQRLEKDGYEVVMHEKLYTHLLDYIPEALQGVDEVSCGTDFTADLAVSIGGDGTFLRTAAWIGSKEIPVVGVNAGHLGYLASLSIEELPELPCILRRGEFVMDSRFLVEVDVPGASLPEGWYPYALNEVVIFKGDTSSMITAEASVDGWPLGDYRADGVIVATPTGSTAYNLSVGGPIVQPSAPVVVISPIAAHSLTMRPLVVDRSSVLDFKVDSRGRNFRLALDGRSVQLPVGIRVRISKAPFVLRTIRLAGHNFADTLRNKLLWGKERD